MTEAEWLTSGNPRKMLDALGRRAVERKLRLFAVACCRAFAESRRDGRRQATVRPEIDLAEQIADGLLANLRDDLGHFNRAYSIFNNNGSTLDWLCHAILDPSAAGAASEVVRRLDYAMWGESPANFGSLALRDIFGNPSRSVAFDPAWRTEAALGIARGIYDRAFERMPILADALQEAGCEDAELLAHCREPGVHVRGCWVVDLVLWKG